MCIIMYLNLPIDVLGSSESLIFGLRISGAGTVEDAEVPMGSKISGEPLVD